MNSKQQKTNQDENLTIGRLAKRVGMRTSALRYYEDQGLLEPAGRTPAGYRLYAPQAEQTLRFIQRAQRLGISLAEIRNLLKGWHEGNLDDEMIITTAETRYLELEKQVTQLLVLEHELELFLADMQRQAESGGILPAPDSLFSRLLDRVCADPNSRPAATMLDWLLEHTGCILTTERGRDILNRLSGQHVHVWQEGHAYHILVVSQDPDVEAALIELARLETECQAHAHHQQAPELMHDGEGYLLVARGPNAFVFARLFLALERETGIHP